MVLSDINNFFVGGGVAYCVYSTSVGSNYYITVANADSTVDFSSTFRFTCYVCDLPIFLSLTQIFSIIFYSLHTFHLLVYAGQAVTTSGGYVLASDNKGACVQDQIPQSKSASGTGTLTFSFIRYTPYIFRSSKMLLNYLLYFK